MNRRSMLQLARRAAGLLLVLSLASCSENQPMTATISPFPSETPLPETTRLPSGAVEVWLTLGDQSKKLSREPDLVFEHGAPASGAVIEVNPQLLYQQFEGAGAAMTESSAYLIMSVLDSAARQQLMRDLFTREGQGIGISYLRVPMGASDFALRDYTYDDLPAGDVDPSLEFFSIDHDRAHIIPALLLARELNPELGLMGSPWSPPAWMKRDAQLHGSSLLPEYYQAFADYHVRFLQAYAEAGLPVNSITPQNEPMYATSGYPTMFMSAADQATLVRDYLGPALKAAGLETQLLIFDHNWDLVDYPLEVLADPTAATYVDGVAFHCYGGDVSAQSLVHDRYPEKGLWFTECSGGGWATDFGGNLAWNMRNLMIGNFRNWGKSTILWNLALDEKDGPQNGGCSNCRGVVTINQASGEVTYNEEYYILGQVTRFVDRGAFRAESTAAGDGVPHNVAFLNPDGSLVLVVQADAAVSFSVSWQGKSFSYQLPSAGVVTFRWHSGATPGPTATAAPYRTATPHPTASVRGVLPGDGWVADFEPGDADVIYSASNAEAQVGEMAHHGNASLLSQSESGNWHVVGVDLAAPLDLSGFQKLCFWVYDTTSGDQSSANNTIGMRLIDSAGNSEERWTDHTGVGENPRTASNSWVQMCFNLGAFTHLDLSSVAKIEFNSYWAGLTYFDEVRVQGSVP